MRERPGEAGAAGRPALQFPSTHPNPGSVHQASQEPELGFWPWPRHKPVPGPPRQVFSCPNWTGRDKVPSLPGRRAAACVSSLWPAGGSAGSWLQTAARAGPSEPLQSRGRSPIPTGSLQQEAPRDIAGRVGLARTPFGSRLTICEGLRNRQGRRGGDPPFYPLT